MGRVDKKKLLDVGFLAFEAVAHISLIVYLVRINAALASIAFTAFELFMFVRLLFNNRKELNRVPCTYHETCCKDEKMEEEAFISWSQYRRLRTQRGDEWWIDTEAAPNGIGPVCLYCGRLIDSHYTDHTVECPVRRYIGWEDYE